MKIKYTKDNPLRCFFAFEGYNSQGMALDRLKQTYTDFDWVCVGRSEIDKYAIQACEAVFPYEVGLNYGDISKINWKDVPDFDLFTYSFPCQDISTAGNQRGLEKNSGTRSSLLWECQKAIEAKKPKYLLMENVKALMSEKFLPYLQKWEDVLYKMGYTSYAEVLNAKDFCIPQNRERVFMVSILGTDQMFHFPEPFKLEVRLKDVLEQNVDEKFYLSDKMVNSIVEHCDRKVSEGCGFKPAFKTPDQIATCISTLYGGRQTDTFVKEPKIVQQFGDRGTKQYSVAEIAHTIPANPMSDRGQMLIEPKAVGYSRDTKGKVVNRFLKDVTNTIKATGRGGNQDVYIAEPKPLNKHLRETLEQNKIPSDEPAYIDAYNRKVKCGIAGSITARIDATNDHYISEPKQDKDR